MPSGKTIIVERIGSMLRTCHEAIVHQPLPKRWVDLIKELNEEEEREQAAARKTKH